MLQRRIGPSSLLLCAAFLLNACAVGGTEATDAGGVGDAGADTGADASEDATIVADAASSDAAIDATMDSGADAGSGDSGGGDAASLDGGASDLGVIVCDPIDSTAVGLWVFDQSNITVPSSRTALFDFAESHNVHTLYAEVDGLIAAALSDATTLTAFVAEAHARCISVEFLFSDPRFILPDDTVPETVDRADLMANVDAIEAFAAAHPEAAPNGIHLYLRPYELDAEWTSDAAAISSEFIDVLAEVQSRAPAFPLNVDIPYWYHTVQVTRGDVMQGLDRWIIDLVPTVTIMAFYDDKTFVVAYAATALGYANDAGKKAIIAIDVQCTDPAPHVSFWEEGTATVLDALEHIHAMEAFEPAFMGVAIRDYEHYRVLRTPESGPVACPES